MHDTKYVLACTISGMRLFHISSAKEHDSDH